MRTAREFLNIVEKLDGKSSRDPDYTLGDWFNDEWVQTGGKYDGKPCARQPGQTTKPYCRDPDDRKKMSKKKRDAVARKKRREDPNPNRSGKAKMVTQEAAGEKDACYKKVKSRYKVWPSAYASGALVKCRKVGASNWGNKTEEMDMFDFIYNFLISENLDEQDVLDIMARVPIDEILEVMELDEDEAWRNRNFRDIPDKSIENVAKRRRQLSKEIQDIEGRKFSRFRPRLRKKKAKKREQLQSLTQAILSKSGQLKAREAVSNAMQSNTKDKIEDLKNRINALKSPHNIVPGPRNIRRSANTIKRFQREEFILEYLLDYGYADTYENAIEIYESMSDDWMMQILSEEF